MFTWTLALLTKAGVRSHWTIEIMVVEAMWQTVNFQMGSQSILCILTNNIDDTYQRKVRFWFRNLMFKHTLSLSNRWLEWNWQLTVLLILGIRHKF